MEQQSQAESEGDGSVKSWPGWSKPISALQVTGVLNASHFCVESGFIDAKSGCGTRSLAS